MLFIRNAILYSLFIVHSANLLSNSHEDTILDENNVLACEKNDCDDHGFEIVVPTENEEIFPLENIDLVLTPSQDQSFVDDLEVDPTVQQDTDHNTDQGDVDADDIMIFHQAEDQTPLEDLESPELVDVLVCYVDDAGANCVEPTQDDGFVDSQKLQEQMLLDVLDIPLFHEDTTLPVDSSEIILAIDNGIAMLEDLKAEIIDEISSDDDIVPVPHELINSVKKAAKKKKKLEERERKEKYKRSKKSKNKDKKSDLA
ncbi:hypothetical protein KBC04_03160 [Candidatus Babeliales bacterium]|nr:hypothetical protein [Candidatus Babeliales bacterium]MBP9843950.1 hypothetical protein [Candidatus Babeliales bacterium]